MMTMLLQWVPIAVSVLAVGLAYGLVRRERVARQALENKFAATEVVLKNARQQQESLTKQLQELRAGTLGMGQKLAEMAQQLETLADRKVNWPCRIRMVACTAAPVKWWSWGPTSTN
ncbi:ATPase [Photobacterium aphoticum]|uniref:ATPase n=1 Tax=Photobacterium aphoticum TaxID=754436 RepID=A0A090R2L5_9GAMM|nr:ATPase [Photobacterium aphoticum]